MDFYVNTTHKQKENKVYFTGDHSPHSGSLVSSMVIIALSRFGSTVTLNAEVSNTAKKCSEFISHSESFFNTIQ